MFKGMRTVFGLDFLSDLAENGASSPSALPWLHLCPCQLAQNDKFLKRT